MQTKSNNVVSLHRHGFPCIHADLIETLLMMVCQGDEIPIESVSQTPLSIEQLTERFQCEPDMVLKGLAMPVFRWRCQLNSHYTELFVVDAGPYRAFYDRSGKGAFDLSAGRTAQR